MEDAFFIYTHVVESEVGLYTEYVISMHVVDRCRNYPTYLTYI